MNDYSKKLNDGNQLSTKPTWQHNISGFMMFWIWRLTKSVSSDQTNLDPFIGVLFSSWHDLKPFVQHRWLIIMYIFYFCSSVTIQLHVKHSWAILRCPHLDNILHLCPGMAICLDSGHCLWSLLLCLHSSLLSWLSCLFSYSWLTLILCHLNINSTETQTNLKILENIKWFEGNVHSSKVN